MENKIQKLFKPMESPRIFGPNTFPSNCIKTIIKIKNKTPLLGLAIKTSTALGIIPMYWPKNGMMFVTPINTLIKMVYGIPAMFIMINVNTPTIRESIIFPQKHHAFRLTQTTRFPLFLPAEPQKSVFSPEHRSFLFLPLDKWKR